MSNLDHNSRPYVFLDIILNLPFSAVWLFHERVAVNRSQENVVEQFNIQQRTIFSLLKHHCNDVTELVGGSHTVMQTYTDTDAFADTFDGFIHKDWFVLEMQLIIVMCLVIIHNYRVVMIIINRSIVATDNHTDYWLSCRSWFDEMTCWIVTAILWSTATLWSVAWEHPISSWISDSFLFWDSGLWRIWWYGGIHRAKCRIHAH